jgi:tetratricopeptide (TPR) repeat protein/tRNA A-37 threonylcarbamoyl transferase component Bud32
MSEAHFFPDDTPSVAALRRVEEVCDRFERSWRAGRRPRLEDHLAQVGEERAELFGELLRLELHYRRRRGERPTRADYATRFPEDGFVIRAAFAGAETLDPVLKLFDGGGPGSPPAGGENTPSPGPPPATMTDPNRTGSVEAPSATLASGQPWASGFPVVPGYEILGELGRGGMGVVYAARHTALKRLTAVKMILSGDYASRVELARFRNEAEAIARLRHPNIVQIYEVGQAGGRPFLALEFIDGGRLDHRIRGNPHPPRVAAGLVAVLARAMDAAHQAGVVHRDLKPANILLCRKPDGPPDAAALDESSEAPLEAFELKITDFGLAKRLDTNGEQTGAGAIVGTPSYMAPEQADGRLDAVGPWTDVYGLTAILYELLTGRPPFKGTTRWETLEQVRTREPASPSQLLARVPRDLETICLKGLRKEPEKRYASARELADDLQRWLDGRPVRARRVPGWERAWKWARRRPTAAALVATALVAALGLATGGLFYHRYDRQQTAARLVQLERARQANQLLAQGLDAERADRLDVAKECWEKALTTLDAEPGAADDETRRQLEEGLARVDPLLKERAGQQARLAARQQFAERREQFGRHRDEVLFHAVRLHEQDAADGAAVIRREAPAALKALDLDAGDPRALAAGLEAFRGVVDAPDLDRVAEECVEVFLEWAECEASGPDGGARRALRLLDGAAGLAQAHGLGASRALHLRRARCLELLGDPAGARAERERGKQVAPVAAVDHFEEALASYRTGNWEAALAPCEEALRLQPDHFWAQYVKALCHLRARRWGEAEFGLKVCLRRRPDHPVLLTLLGVAHGGLKEYTAAEADFARALAVPSEPALRAAILTSRSGVCLLAGRTDDAERDLHEAIRLAPNLYQVYVHLARLLESRNDRAGALAQIDRALALHPDHPAIAFMHARLHAEAGDPAAARQDFERVIATQPAGTPSDWVLSARVELAHLRLKDGDKAGALVDCDAVLAVRPDYAAALRQKTEVLLALGKHEEAASALDRYLAVGGTPTGETYRARGILYARQRKYTQAREAYTLALVLKKDAETYSDRGWAFVMQGAAEPALDDFGEALKRDPQHADALAGRGLALVMRGRPADLGAATAAAEKSLLAGPRSVPRLTACARIYARAAGVLEAARDRSSVGVEPVQYRRRAVELLGEAMAVVPRREQPAFWREGVLTDSALWSLRDTPGWLELARAYGR